MWLRALFAVGLCLAPVLCAAQELVPRAYWPAPNGTNVVVVGYQYSTGDVVTDPTLPITGVDSRLNTLNLAYQRTLSVLGRTANLQFAVPMIDGQTTGTVAGIDRERNLSAFADSRIQFSINLLGAPTMDRQAFQALRARPRPIIGASVLLQPPTGAYDDNRLINAGTNRWAAKLGLGAIWPIHPKWLLETDVGLWLFEDNDDFLGQTRKQDPVASLSVHLVRRIKPGFWASLDANYYYGGESQLGGQHHADLQRNSRLGATLVFPVQLRHAIKFSYSSGVATRSGGDYDLYAVSYIFGW